MKNKEYTSIEVSGDPSKIDKSIKRWEKENNVKFTEYIVQYFDGEKWEHCQIMLSEEDSFKKNIQKIKEEYKQKLFPCKGRIKDLDGNILLEIDN